MHIQTPETFRVVSETTYAEADALDSPSTDTVSLAWKVPDSGSPPPCDGRVSDCCGSVAVQLPDAVPDEVDSEIEKLVIDQKRPFQVNVKFVLVVRGLGVVVIWVGGPGGWLLLGA